MHAEVASAPCITQDAGVLAAADVLVAAGARKERMMGGAL